MVPFYLQLNKLYINGHIMTDILAERSLSCYHMLLPLFCQLFCQLIFLFHFNYQSVIWRSALCIDYGGYTCITVPVLWTRKL
jgi:hypothetical protein